MKKILFLISHPAHFHLFKLAIGEFKLKGYKLIIIIRPKDVLEQLCLDSGLEYIKIKDKPKRFGLLGMGISVIKKDIEILRIVKKEKPDLLIGSDGTLAHVGFLTGTPSFEFSEDDAEVVKLYAHLFFPFYTHIVSPEVTSAWKWENKKIGYNSYHELAYLHPNHFKPDFEVIKKYINPELKYFIIRFAKLSAHHDTGITGINNQIALKLVEILKPYGKIIISTERELVPELDIFRMKIDPLDMHHMMAFSQIYIGDSQTMAAEAGVLGVPFIRFNDFVGRLSYLKELEDNYQLGFGIKTKDVELLYSTVHYLLEMPDRKKVFSERRSKMLSEKIDYARFQIWFIDNFPESIKIIKKDSNFQYKFR